MFTSHPRQRRRQRSRQIHHINSTVVRQTTVRSRHVYICIIMMTAFIFAFVLFAFFPNANKNTIGDRQKIIQQARQKQNASWILTDDERIKYYMGKWYNDSLYFNVTPSDWIDGHHHKTSVWSIFDKASYDYNISEWDWNEFFDFLNLSNKQSFECEQDFKKQAIFQPHDVTSKVQNIPIFVRVREFGKNYPIPLQVFRYAPQFELPVKMYNNETSYEDPLWKDKESVAIWRGAHSGQERGERLSFVKQYYASSSSMIDVAYADYETRINLTAPSISHQDMLKNKFLISIEGNDVATNLKWILLSNSCPFMPTPTRESWAMEGLLEPYVHFIPISQNKSNGKWNLEQQIEYCLKNDEECDKIAQNGKKFMIGNKFLDVKHELWMQQQILDRYCKQYYIMLEQ